MIKPRLKSWLIVPPNLAGCLTKECVGTYKNFITEPKLFHKLDYKILKCRKATQLRFLINFRMRTSPNLTKSSVDSILYSVHF